MQAASPKKVVGVSGQTVYHPARRSHFRIGQSLCSEISGDTLPLLTRTEPSP